MTRFVLAAIVLLSGCAEQAAPKAPLCAVWEHGACIDSQVGPYVPARDEVRWVMMSQDANGGDETIIVEAICRDHADCSNRVEMANLEQAEIGGSLVFYVSGDKTP